MVFGGFDLNTNSPENQLTNVNMFGRFDKHISIFPKEIRHIFLTRESYS